MFNAIGIKPSEATRAVVITGLNLVTAPSIIALSSNWFLEIKSRINETSTNPFRIAIPDNAIKPTAADIEKGMPRRYRAKIPPVSANGTPEKIMSESFIEPSAKNKSKKIRTSVTGTTMLKRSDADCSF